MTDHPELSFAGRVLVVDDVAENRDVLTRRLVRCKFDVMEAEDGEQALAKVAEAHPDLVLLDWMMPGLSGLDVLKVLRERWSADQMPVIMVTARDESESIVSAFDAGANDYVVKPVDFRVVLARVKAQLERVQALRALEAMNGTLRGDLEKHVEIGAQSRRAVMDAMQRRREAETGLMEALREAEAAARAKAAFLTNISHEFRTPLNAIIGFAQMMDEGVHGPLGATAYDEYTTDILTSSRHLLSLVNAALEAARLEQGPTAISDEPANLIDIAGDALAIVRPEARKRSVHLDANAGELTIDLLVDARAIRQILINLVSNAIKHSDEGATVSLTAQRPNHGGVEVVVQDTGPGFDPEMLNQAFEPFQRVDANLSSRTDGLGLGLAIARALAESHDGSLRVESAPGKGASAILTLPRGRVISGAATVRSA